MYLYVSNLCCAFCKASVHETGYVFVVDSLMVCSAIRMSSFLWYGMTLLVWY
jgi:hypothetical protein